MVSPEILPDFLVQEFFCGFSPRTPPENFFKNSAGDFQSYTFVNFVQKLLWGFRPKIIPGISSGLSIKKLHWISSAEKFSKIFSENFFEDFLQKFFWRFEPIFSTSVFSRNFSGNIRQKFLRGLSPKISHRNSSRGLFALAICSRINPGSSPIIFIGDFIQEFVRGLH